MNTKFLSLVVLSVILVIPAYAQDARCYAVMDESSVHDGLAMLIQREEVKADLSLSADQETALTEDGSRSQLQAVLDPPQMVRLNQLLIQMRGPVIIVTDTNIQSQLQLSADQTATLSNTVSRYEFWRWPFINRYGRQQVAGIVRQSMDERLAELDALYLATTEIIKDRDKDLLHTLSNEQRRVFEQLGGRPLSIAWPKHTMVFGDNQKKK